MPEYRRQLGNNGENIAAEYLESKGYVVLEQNFRNRYGEVDIIAKDNSCIVLVEVKTKTDFTQGLPQEKVDYFKQKKLRLLARSLEQTYPENDIRIDVVAVDLSSQKQKIEHFVNAVEE